MAPGGGVEGGETPEVAAVREAAEELGIGVAIRHKVLELRGLHPRGRVQHYFLATCTEATFGSMTGPERASASNTYTPRRVRLVDIETLNVLPDELRAFLGLVAREGWPDEPVVVSRSG